MGDYSVSTVEDETSRNSSVAFDDEICPDRTEPSAQYHQLEITRYSKSADNEVEFLSPDEAHTPESHQQPQQENPQNDEEQASVGVIQKN